MRELEIAARYSGGGAFGKYAMSEDERLEIVCMEVGIRDGTSITSALWDIVAPNARAAS